MVRTEISLFLKNAPGELARLTLMLAENKINIDAITIQDATSYVNELFKARGKTLKRHATAASYGMIQKDSENYALVRLLVNDTDKTLDLLSQGGYLYEITPVMALELENHPGSLAATAQKIGDAGININYVYGSVSPAEGKTLFIFCPEDIDMAAKAFQKD
ncbi:MAG: amino acid-binding protein [Deltaproteobacteria bacterium]|nr:amino acid-binding protein [Candidatus Anaeroferrophillus wilburensis]MBN2888621.1 amino acid-binding protein [Deltaproteobacteria bacterium]